jgi:hypothetical protein
MLKKFTEGLVFGAGFAISYLVLWYVTAYLITPMFIGSQIEQVEIRRPSDLDTKTQSSISRNPETLRESGPPFHELKLEEQIKKSSVIALAKYEPSPDGKMKAIIKEFLKNEPGTTLYYKVGDEYASSSYYPKDKTSYGDGLVIFFVGSPATMRMSMSYEGDRIRGLGDLPLELLKRKCKEPNA